MGAAMSKLKIRVFHGYYGCDTGCCGHIIEVENGKGPGRDIYSFKFSHPYNEDFKEWATEFAQDYIKSKHPNCYDSIDWDTLEYKDVSDD